MDWGIDLKKTEWNVMLQFLVAMLILAVSKAVLNLVLQMSLLPRYEALLQSALPNIQISDRAGHTTWFFLQLLYLILRNLRQPTGLPIEILKLFGLTVTIIVLHLLSYLTAGMYFVRYIIKEKQRIKNIIQKEQESQDRERSLMLSDIAHDIRNPITVISGCAQALDDGMVTDPEKQSEYLHIIRTKSKRVEDLISILFEYAKLNSTGFRLQKSTADASEFLRRTAAQLYPDVEQAGMELIPEIPNQVELRTFDSIQFSRVIINLVNNAIKYNSQGCKILIRYTVDPEAWEDDVLLIADSGDVIDAETVGRLFEPFSRGDQSRPTDGGSGLGLSIVKSIVELHGGTIEYQEHVEGYTKGFLIRIPRES